MPAEKIRDGHERSFDELPSGACRVSIRHRLTSANLTPVRWSAWECWGEFESAHKARAEHDYALANGPWGGPEHGTTRPAVIDITGDDQAPANSDGVRTILGVIDAAVVMETLHPMVARETTLAYPNAGTSDLPDHALSPAVRAVRHVRAQLEAVGMDVCRCGHIQAFEESVVALIERALVNGAGSADFVEIMRHCQDQCRELAATEVDAILREELHKVTRLDSTWYRLVTVSLYGTLSALAQGFFYICRSADSGTLLFSTHQESAGSKKVMCAVV